MMRRTSEKHGHAGAEIPAAADAALNGTEHTATQKILRGQVARESFR